MPFIQADFSGLEVVTAAFLSQDAVLCLEIIEGIDIHSSNQKLFNLPDRKTAKIFFFRYIYGGTEYAYAKDSDFSWISSDPKYWKNVIDNLAGKYEGLVNWHKRQIKEAMLYGKLVLPTGRVLPIAPFKTDSGQYKWPITNIKNYPVQALAADLVCIARVDVYNKLKNTGNLLFISTVHDSIVIDTTTEQLKMVGQELKEAVERVPGNFEKIWKSKFNLPMKCELKVGLNLKDMTVMEI